MVVRESLFNKKSRSTLIDTIDTHVNRQNTPFFEKKLEDLKIPLCTTFTVFSYMMVLGTV